MLEKDHERLVAAATMTSEELGRARAALEESEKEATSYKEQFLEKAKVAEEVAELLGLFRKQHTFPRIWSVGTWRYLVLFFSSFELIFNQGRVKFLEAELAGRKSDVASPVSPASPFSYVGMLTFLPLFFLSRWNVWCKFFVCSFFAATTPTCLLPIVWTATRPKHRSMFLPLWAHLPSTLFLLKAFVKRSVYTVTFLETMDTKMVDVLCPPIFNPVSLHSAVNFWIEF